MTIQQSTPASGRVALVTGATGIIGPSICQVLRREGWRVAAADRSMECFESYKRLFGAVDADACFSADFTGRDICHQLVRQVEQQLGPVALLVNNACANPIRATLQEIEEPYARMMLEVNLLAPLWLAQAAEASLATQKGCVINISSVMVKKVFPAQYLYPAAKAALEMLTASLAAELGPKGIRVNGLRLGLVPGPTSMRRLLDKLPEEHARGLHAHLVPHQRDNAARMSMTDRAGLPNDVAHAIAFLASPRAEFFHGAVLPLDGGMQHMLDVNRPNWNWLDDAAQWLKSRGIDMPELGM